MNEKQIIHAVNQLPELKALASERYEPYGIYNSEIAAILGVCRALNIDMVIESGRARGQSTYLLAKYLGAHGVEIHSIELRRDVHAIFAEQRLSGFKEKLVLHYGDSNELIPRLIRQAVDRKIALLVDGPKSRKAIDLLSAAVAMSPDVKVGFIHDLQRLRKGIPYLSRTLVERYFDNVLFTDDEEYVQTFRHLDAHILGPRGVAPYHKGDEYTASYGPTLGVIFATEADRLRARRRGRTNTFAHRTLWTARRLLTGDLILAIVWDLRRSLRRSFGNR